MTALEKALLQQEIENLKDIYKNLQFIKYELIEIIKKEK